MKDITLEKRKITFKNFAGKVGPYNQRGERTFSVLIENEKEAKQLKKDGWNVKPLLDEEGNPERWHIPVRVNYDSEYPPRIYKVLSDTLRTTLLSADTVSLLDTEIVDYVNVALNPYRWRMNGREGVRAYCTAMYAFVTQLEIDKLWEQHAKEWAEEYDEDLWTCVMDEEGLIEWLEKQGMSIDDYDRLDDAERQHICLRRKRGE